ncbi:MAG TPA: DNA-processing protein DprA [Acidimicrobiales bacterium]|nr:DNA-processing protein DprA [Acidimicrobiales bacterium]
MTDSSGIQTMADQQALSDVPVNQHGTGPSESESDLACGAALAGLPGMTPVRLAKILADVNPVRAWEALAQGRHPADEQRRFMRAVRAIDPDVVAEAYERAGASVHLRSTSSYPAVLRSDPGAPAVLFSRGAPSVVDDGPRVAIVGTRSATTYGLQTASELARELASAGVVVVSGLALGIDGAAHTGALRTGRDDPAPPVAVVGTGLDVVYPKGNASLWREVEDHGVVFSEAALGTTPRARVFPARNRIIAALSDVVVVVECQLGGGALYTAEAAARRSIPVCAVPGSVRSPASAGTNGLLVDGCTPVRDVDDVLTAVALSRCGRDSPAPAVQSATFVAAKGRDRPSQPSRPGRSTGSAKLDRSVGSAASAASAGSDTRAASGRRQSQGTPSSPRPATVQTSFDLGVLGEDARTVLTALEGSPTTMDAILRRTGFSLARAAAACDALSRAGAVDAGPGWWATR